MKKLLLLVMLIANCYALVAQQLDSSGKSHVNFSIDGDIRNNFQKISTLPYSATSHHDDWFLQDGYKRFRVDPLPAMGLGNSIFDTVGTATYKAQLQANQNISFVKRMKVAAFDVMPMWRSANPADGFDSSFWVDGVYWRDYAGNLDVTSFSGGKNGDNPNNWTVGNSASAKSDIVDVYTHVRTSGLNPVRDSVWFFAGVSTMGTNGTRFFDIEVYREEFAYNETTKKFISAGTVSGHSPWTFDSGTGKVNRTGDIIISVAYQAGRAPEIDFRIFINKSTYDSATTGKLTPATFKFVTSQFNLNTENTGGYIQIAAKDGTANWGSGMANYVATNTAAQDTTMGPPWGTLNSTGQWTDRYEQLQFIEIGLNFSRFGMNPFQYVTSFCKSPYSSIIVKSRASTSFTANLEDFIIPQTFTVKNLAPFTVKPDTVTCASPTGNFEITASARNYYRWYDENGTLLRADSDVKTFTAPKSGTYYLEATNFQGCATMLPRQAVQIYADSTSPTAAALLGHGQPYYFLNGVGGVTGSSFGPSSLSYSWVGPMTSADTLFRSNAEDPIVGYVKDSIRTGNYELMVTQARNGCSATSIIYVDPIVLVSNAINLKGKLVNSKAQLNWNSSDITQTAVFDIERSTNGIQFIKVGHTTGVVGTKQYSYTDYQPVSGSVQYRIKSTTTGTGTAVYSNTLSLQLGVADNLVMSRQPASNRVTIQLKQADAKKVQIKVMSLDGRLLLQQTFSADQVRTLGSSITLSLPSSATNQPVVVVYQEANLIEVRKL